MIKLKTIEENSNKDRRLKKNHQLKIFSYLVCCNLEGVSESLVSASLLLVLGTA